jgi:MFS superfamily sulfate permease-like transporter
MVDDAGGRSQLAQLSCGAVVLLVLLFLTGPLAYLPLAALASVVFLIGVELVDVRALREVWEVRKDEFAIALVTAVTVVAVSVGVAIGVAVVASIIDHLRISHSPRTGVLVTDPHTVFRPQAVTPAARTIDGVVVYRFLNTLYYANAHRLLDDVHTLLEGEPPLRTFCLDCVAIGDVDFTGGALLRRVHRELAEKQIRLVLAEVSDPVRAELDRYGITRLVGEDAYFATLVDVLRAATAPDG